MKTLKLRATLLLLGSLTLGFSATIDEQITAIQEASPEDRVELVNEFKTTLQTLTTDERTAAIEQLKTTMQVDGQQIQTRTQQRDRLNQTAEVQEVQEAQMNQRMNQHQVASQAMGRGIIQTIPTTTTTATTPTTTTRTPNGFFNR